MGSSWAGRTGMQIGALPSFKTSVQQTYFSYATGVTAGGDRNRVSPGGVLLLQVVRRVRRVHAIDAGGGERAPGDDGCRQPRRKRLLNVSYDPTRELYQEFNAAFAKYWQAKTGKTVAVKQSHGGSGAQARAVIDGLDADVVTLALAYDIDAIAASGLIKPDWQKRLPQNSAPYTSTIVFLVRKGNPKGIKDWGDLVKPGVQIITPNPKTSGGARWNYLAAWGYALKQPGGNDAKARDFVAELFKKVPVLDSGRARRDDDVRRARHRRRAARVGERSVSGAGRSQGQRSTSSSRRSASLPSRPWPSWTRSSIGRGRGPSPRRTCSISTRPEGQEIAAKHHYRPRDAKVAAKYANSFAKVKLFTIDETFGGWQKAQKTHFADGGTFDQIYRPGGRTPSKARVLMSGRSSRRAFSRGSG